MSMKAARIPMSNSAPCVLIVDDEQRLRRFLRAGFEMDGFSVFEAGDGKEGLKLASLKPMDLIVLDLGLPAMSGADVVARLRDWTTVPIIVLTVQRDEAEKVRLFNLGADDYVVKPFGMAELLARARAAVRRQSRGRTGKSAVISGPLVIDLASRLVTLNGDAVQLSPKEFRLLQVLAQHQGSVVTHEQLLKEVWGITRVGDTHYLRIVVRRLRQKVESDPKHPRILLTELGVGYRLANAREPEASDPSEAGDKIANLLQEKRQI
jgi:two-component system KDP operon response regulator KdpE